MTTMTKPKLTKPQATARAEARMIAGALAALGGQARVGQLARMLGLPEGAVYTRLKACSAIGPDAPPWCYFDCDRDTKLWGLTTAGRELAESEPADGEVGEMFEHTRNRQAPEMTSIRRPGMYWLDTSVPERVETSSAPLLPAASAALTPGQLEVRLQVYEYLAEQNIPLFEDTMTPVEHTGDGHEARARCWGCGRPTPLREGGLSGQRYMACKAPGWSAPQVLTGAGGVRVETWCPECAAMAGFGCVEEPEHEMPAAVSVRVKRA